jgi:hypothetical protein
VWEIQHNLIYLETLLQGYEAAYGFPSAAWFAVDVHRESLEGMAWNEALDRWAHTYRLWLIQLVQYRSAMNGQHNGHNQAGQTSSS